MVRSVGPCRRDPCWARPDRTDPSVRVTCSVSSGQHRYGQAQDAFTSTDGTELLGRTSLHGDGCRHHLGEPTLDLDAAGRDARALAHQCAVDVADRPTRGSYPTNDIAQQLDRVGSGERGIGIGKQLADVTEASRTKERIGTGVGENVGITVALQAALTLELDATEDEDTTRVVAERVHVETLTDPDLHGVGRYLSDNS